MPLTRIMKRRDTDVLEALVSLGFGGLLAFVLAGGSGRARSRGDAAPPATVGGASPAARHATGATSPPGRQGADLSPAATAAARAQQSALQSAQRKSTQTVRKFT